MVKRSALKLSGEDEDRPRPSIDTSDPIVATAANASSSVGKHTEKIVSSNTPPCGASDQGQGKKKRRKQIHKHVIILTHL